MPLNSREIHEVKNEAVRLAESKVHDGRKGLDRFAGVIDRYEELEVFYETSKDEMIEYLEKVKDPRLSQHKAAFEKIYREVKDGVRDYKGIYEEMADAHFEAMLFVLEEDERANLKHGPGLLKDLGIDGEVELLHFDDGKEKSYRVKHNGLVFYLLFDENNRITLELPRRGSDHLRFLESSQSLEERSRRPIERELSLMELRDLSAFEVHLVFLDSTRLLWLVDEISESLGVVPKRTSNVDLQKFVSLRNDCSAFRADVIKLEKDGREDEHLTATECAQFLERAKALFVRRLELFYSGLQAKKPDNHIFDLNEQESIGSIVYKYPHLYEVAISTAKTLQQLSILEVDEDKPDLRLLYEKRVNQLSSAKVESLDRNRKFGSLSKQKKDVCVELLKLGLLTDNELNSFLVQFAKLNISFLPIYEKFLRENPDEFLKNPARLTFFTRNAIRLKDTLSFEFFCRVWEEMLKDTWASNYVNVVVETLNAFSDYDHLSLAITVLKGRLYLEDLGFFKKAVEQLMRIKSKGRLDYSKVEYVGDEYHGDTLLYGLSCLEYLDDDFFENRFLTTKRFGYKLLTLQNIAVLNSLGPVQREGLNYCSKMLPLLTQEDFDKYIALLKRLSDAAQVSFLRDSIVCESLGKFEEAIGFVESYSRVLAKSGEINLDLSVYLNAKHPVHTLVFKKVPEGEILRLLPKLARLKLAIQLNTLRHLVGKDNVEQVVDALLSVDKNAKELDGNMFENYYYTMLYDKGLGIAEVSEVLDRLVKLSHLKDRCNDPGEIDFFNKFLGVVLGYKLSAVTVSEQFVKFADAILSKGFFEEFDSYLKELSTSLADASFDKSQQAVGILVAYLNVGASFEDFENPRQLFSDLRQFSIKAKEVDYDLKTDPDFNKAIMLLGVDKVLERETGSFTNVAFILNILLNEEQGVTREVVRNWATEHLGCDKAVLRNKAARLLIGLGTNVDEISPDVLVKIAREGVDNKLTGRVLSDKVLPAHLDYISKKGVKMPLCLYFSILITLDEENKSQDLEAFSKLVDRYTSLEKDSVFKGKILVLSHNVDDATHSYLISKDSFSTTAYRIIAHTEGLDIEVLRHGKDDESVESMFTTLERTKGDVTVVIGGHGAPGSISYGAEIFSLNTLYKRLASRLIREGGNLKWNTRVLFFSCFSGFNARRLMNYWKQNGSGVADSGLQELSSSSETTSSYKMAEDTWILVARKLAKLGKKLDWATYYREIESRNFVMGDVDKGVLSNSTLFIDGKPLF